LFPAGTFWGKDSTNASSEFSPSYFLYFILPLTKRSSIVIMIVTKKMNGRLENL